MPMREYLCQPCHRVYTFMTATVDDARRPVCPRCGDTHLEKQMSSFARVQRRKEPLAAIPKRPGEVEAGGIDQGRRDRDGRPVETDSSIYLLWEHCVDGDPSPLDDHGLRPTQKHVHEGMGGDGPKPPGLVVFVKHKADGR